MLCVLFMFGFVRSQHNTFKDVSEFPLTMDGLLKDHWIVYPTNCASVIQSESEFWSGTNARKFASIEGELEKGLFDNDRSKSAEKSPLGCPAICLEKGTPKSNILSPIEYKVYSGKRHSIKFKSYLNEIQDYDRTDNRTDVYYPLNEWIGEICHRVEIGWVSYRPNPVNIIWLAQNGAKHSVGQLLTGEKKTIWQTSTLGNVPIL